MEGSLMDRAMESIFRRTEWRGDCLEVTGTTIPERLRYGQVRVGGKNYRATRVVYASVHGWESIEGLGVLHSCDNPPCVNINHLSAGDQRENNRQMVERGRCRNQYMVSV